MRLTLKDNRRITGIIKQLSNEDTETIRNEVERLHSLKTQNPLFHAVMDYHPGEFTSLVDEWLSLSDTDYQVLLSECFWDALTFRVTREFAIQRFLLGESWDEP